MLTLYELIDTLGYTTSSHYRRIDEINEPETAHLFRVAAEANVHSVYLFKTSSGAGENILPSRPVVYIAKATTEHEANEIHRNLWNLNYAPFLIVCLPHQIRIYTGFVYSHNNDSGEHEGLLDEFDDSQLNQIVRLLSDFSVNSIDSGNIWESPYGEKLNPERRVDKHLLRNLQKLGDALKKDLPSDIAHALIGKYVYISYLHHRGILTDSWLMQNGIEPHSIFTSAASVQSLNKLTRALENRFNGKVFPIQFSEALASGLKDKHVSWVASVFNGGEILGPAPEMILQLPLLFKVYDFHYIPVETLSAIYEQFIEDRKGKGAIYTPEFLADYLLSEVEWAKPFTKDGKLLDPACGSGIFLVLAYRRLIEKEIQRLGRNLSPLELRAILQESIFGVERELDACYVTEFSLILTLLHYVEPPDLDKLEFKFPALHNTNIFHADFFDLQSENTNALFWQQNLMFDWIVGNPPWASKLHKQRDKYTLDWINSNTKQCPVSGERVAEVFSWLVTELLKPTGVVGLLMPATSLLNQNSHKYRQFFFSKHKILRVTNFANLRDILFGKGKSSVLPAATLLYTASGAEQLAHRVIHYGPFSVNQKLQGHIQPWTIIINENEITSFLQQEAINGNSFIWKMALWGTFLDKDVIERIKYHFTKTLNNMCRSYGWHLREASQLRNKDTHEKTIFMPELKEQKIVREKGIMKTHYRFSVESPALEDIHDSMCYVRKQGGLEGLKTTYAPHIIISPRGRDFVIYSVEDFVLRPRYIGISANDNPETSNILKAIACYLNSSLVAYYLFFHSHEWGVFRQTRRIITSQVGKLPVPDFNHSQIEVLATLYDEIAQTEKQAVQEIVKKAIGSQQTLLDKSSSSVTIEELTSSQRKKIQNQLEQLRATWYKKIDETIYSLFEIPSDIRTTVDEFIEIRLLLDNPSTISKVITQPTPDELLAYARQLQEELNEFASEMFSHQVMLTTSDDLIECVVKMAPFDRENSTSEVNVQKGGKTKTELLISLSKQLREQVSQWIYIQRGLRLFDGSKIYIYKSPRRIDWTRTQAILDAHDIIGQVLSTSGNYADANYALA